MGEYYGVCLKQTAVFHQWNRGFYHDVEAVRHDQKEFNNIKHIYS